MLTSQLNRHKWGAVFGPSFYLWDVLTLIGELLHVSSLEALTSAAGCRITSRAGDAAL